MTFDKILFIYLFISLFYYLFFTHYLLRAPFISVILVSPSNKRLYMFRRKVVLYNNINNNKYQLCQ